MRICQNCSYDVIDPELKTCPECGAELRKAYMIYFARFRRFSGSKHAAYYSCKKLLNYLEIKNVKIYFEPRCDTLYFYRQLTDNDMKHEGFFDVKNADRKPLAEVWDGKKLRDYSTLKDYLFPLKNGDTI